MSRPDISRREPHKVETVRDDEFYETMPMVAEPIMRERTTEVTEPTDQGAESVNGGLLLAERIISYITGVLLALLGLRLILAAFSYFEVITTANEFARFIYGITNPLIAPFSSLFNTSNIDPDLWAIGFAMLVYGLIGYAIVHLLRLGQPKNF